MNIVNFHWKQAKEVYGNHWWCYNMIYLLNNFMSSCHVPNEKMSRSMVMFSSVLLGFTIKNHICDWFPFIVVCNITLWRVIYSVRDNYFLLEFVTCHPYIGSGVVCTMDHEVGPWKRAFFNGFLKNWFWKPWTPH